LFPYFEPKGLVRREFKNMDSYDNDVGALGTAQPYEQPPPSYNDIQQEDNQNIRRKRNYKQL